MGVHYSGWAADREIPSSNANTVNKADMTANGQTNVTDERTDTDRRLRRPREGQTSSILGMKQVGKHELCCQSTEKKQEQEEEEKFGQGGPRPDLAFFMGSSALLLPSTFKILTEDTEYIYILHKQSSET